MLEDLRNTASIFYEKLESLGVAQHANDARHDIEISHVKLIKDVNLPRELDTYQAIYMREYYSSVILFITALVISVNTR